MSVPTPNTFDPLRKVTDPVGDPLPLTGVTIVVSFRALFRLGAADDVERTVSVASLFAWMLFELPAHPDTKKSMPTEQTTTSKRMLRFLPGHPKKRRQAKATTPPASFPGNAGSVTLASGVEARIVRFELTVPVLLSIGVLNEQVSPAGSVVGQLNTMFAVFRVVPALGVTVKAMGPLPADPAGTVTALCASASWNAAA